MGNAKNVDLSPEVVRKQKLQGQVLVVDADYFALTIRIDPNVIFWMPGQSSVDSVIPSGVRYIWISKWTAPEIRIALRAQAKERGIEIWECVIGELIRRLIPFWKEPANRSLIRPVQPKEDAVDELDQMSSYQSRDDASDAGLIGESFNLRSVITENSSQNLGADEEELAEEKENRQLQKAKDRRLKLLKKSAARVAAQRFQAQALPAKKVSKPGRLPQHMPEPSERIKVIKPSPVLFQELAKLPVFDRKVFCFHFGLGDSVVSVIPSIERTVSEFKIPAVNVQRILKRVSAELAQADSLRNQQDLITALSRYG
jgi:hypothetical protein